MHYFAKDVNAMRAHFRTYHSGHEVEYSNTTVQSFIRKGHGIRYFSVCNSSITVTDSLSDSNSLVANLFNMTVSWPAATIFPSTSRLPPLVLSTNWHVWMQEYEILERPPHQLNHNLKGHLMSTPEETPQYSVLVKACKRILDDIQDNATYRNVYFRMRILRFADKSLFEAFRPLQEEQSKIKYTIYLANMFCFYNTLLVLSASNLPEAAAATAIVNNVKIEFRDNVQILFHNITAITNSNTFNDNNDIDDHENFNSIISSLRNLLVIIVNDTVDTVNDDSTLIIFPFIAIQSLKDNGVGTFVNRFSSDLAKLLHSLRGVVMLRGLEIDNDISITMQMKETLIAEMLNNISVNSNSSFQLVCRTIALCQAIARSKTSPPRLHFTSKELTVVVDNSNTVSQESIRECVNSAKATVKHLIAALAGSEIRKFNVTISRLENDKFTCEKAGFSFLLDGSSKFDQLFKCVLKHWTLQNPNSAQYM